jgi:hypothetical protein
MAPEPPKVFISYSHDSTEHAERVLELSNRLLPLPDFPKTACQVLGFGQARFIGLPVYLYITDLI